MPDEHATTHPAASLALALDLMRSEGHDAQACLRGTGLTVSDLSEETRTVTLQQETIFYRNLLQLTRDPCIGLRIGQTYLPQRYGLFGYALLSASTARQALAIAVNFGHHLTFTWFRMSFAVVGNSVHFEFSDRTAMDADVRAMYFDRDCAGFRIAAEELLRKSPDIGHVWLPHEDYGCRQRYETYFGCPVSFGHPTAKIEFPVSLLDEPLPFRDEVTSRRLAHQCRLLLSKLRRQGELVEKVRDLLIARPGFFPGIEWVAEKLQTSVRTLRRQLAEKGASYQTVLDEVRLGLAQEYLTETDLPLHEIAPLLGFSEAGNFTHAFKRWTGDTPNAYRKKGIA
jgi:AraC-like DNA-binding protein